MTVLPIALYVLGVILAYECAVALAVGAAVPVRRWARMAIWPPAYLRWSRSADRRALDYLEFDLRHLVRMGAVTDVREELATVQQVRTRLNAGAHTGEDEEQVAEIVHRLLPPLVAERVHRPRLVLVQVVVLVLALAVMTALVLEVRGA